MYQRFTRHELEEAFALVVNRADCHAAIDAVVQHDQLDVVLAAINFFTGDEATTEPMVTGVRVRSAGCPLRSSGA